MQRNWNRKRVKRAEEKRGKERKKRQDETKAERSKVEQGREMRSRKEGGGVKKKRTANIEIFLRKRGI